MSKVERVSILTDSEFEADVLALCESLNICLVGLIGAGAFKRVYEVQHPVDGPFALKVIAGQAANPRDVREAQVLRESNHPNIVTFIESGTESLSTRPVSYVIEELLRGGTLAERKERLSVPHDIKSIAHAISSALAYLSEKGVVHRDIKPENIMFRSNSDEPILVDFGLARLLYDVSLTATWAMRGPGTPYYASPEQLRNEKALIDWRSDQFSLGITLSVVALGVHPYQYEGEPIFDSAAVERVAHREAMAPQFEALAIEQGLGPLVKMVSVFPIDRYHSPSQLLAAWKID